jgi:hypothetical protein
MIDLSRAAPWSRRSMSVDIEPQSEKQELGGALAGLSLARQVRVLAVWPLSARSISRWPDDSIPNRWPSPAPTRWASPAMSGGCKA